VQDDDEGIRVFSAANGGHAGSANNGVYGFDVVLGAWSILKAPDDPSAWDPRYIAAPGEGGTTTYYQPAGDRWALSGSYGSANVYTDEFYDEARPAASTRNPTARHTYKALVYHRYEEAGQVRRKLFMHVRRHWRFDVPTARWDDCRFPFDRTFSGPDPVYTGAEGYSGEECFSFVDEATAELCCGPTQDYGGSRFLGYGLRTGAWRDYPHLVSGWDASGHSFEKVGRRVFGLRKVTSDLNNDGSPASYPSWPPALLVLDLDTARLDSLAMSGLEQRRCPPVDWYYDGQDLCGYPGSATKLLWVTRYQRDVASPVTVSPGAEALPTLFEVDIAAGTIERSAWPGAEDLPSPASIWVGRAKALHSIGCVLLFGAASEEIAIVRTAAV
jgi:hypothetical protein